MGWERTGEVDVSPRARLRVVRPGDGDAAIAQGPKAGEGCSSVGGRQESNAGSVERYWALGQVALHNCTALQQLQAATGAGGGASLLGPLSAKAASGLGNPIHSQVCREVLWFVK